MAIIFESRNASDIDIEAHAEFQRTAFNKRFALISPLTVQTNAYYAWKYASPVGDVRIVQAIEEGNLVGSASGIPVRLASHGSATIGWQICDLATAKHLRGRGLLSRCLARLLEDIGIGAFMYCLPNALSRGSLVRAGFVETGNLRIYVLGRPGLSGLARKALGQTSTVRSELAPFEELGLDLFDAATLYWRFQSRPGIAYEIAEIESTPGAVIVLRSIKIAGVYLGLLVGLRTRELSRDQLQGWLASAVRAQNWRAVVSLSEASPFTNAHRVPGFILPRSFPVLCRNLSSGVTCFGAAEWDVL
jgi:hypothetical protein